MKKRTILKLSSAVIALALLTVGAVASSTQRKENKDLYYNGITIMIDGAEYVAKDANGNVVAPFIMDGTTYLPVRAVANAFDKDVEWDGKTNTVYIGKKDRMAPDNRLDKIQYVDYREHDKDAWMNVINGTVTDYLDNTYTNGLVFYTAYSGANIIEVDYPLNGQYSTLCGTIALPKNINTAIVSNNNCKHSDTNVIVYGDDGDILYKATGVTASMPFDFDIDVDGVNMITIKVQTQEDYSFVALTDLALYE